MRLKLLLNLFAANITVVFMLGCTSLVQSSTLVPTSTLTTAPIETPIPTKIYTFTSEPSMTVTPYKVLGAFMSPQLQENEVCNEYTPIPQKGWAYYPTDFEPVGYVRVFVVDEVFLDPVVVELGLFIKAEELKLVGGKKTFLYDGQYPFRAYSAIRFQDAPQDIQHILSSGKLIAGIEIVDLENHTLPYIPNEQSLKDINYVVDDYIPHPALDLALPCPGLANGRPINYAATLK